MMPIRHCSNSAATMQLPFGLATSTALTLNYSTGSGHEYFLSRRRSGRYRVLQCGDPDFCFGNVHKNCCTFCARALRKIHCHARFRCFSILRWRYRPPKYLNATRIVTTKKLPNCSAMGATRFIYRDFNLPAIKSRPSQSTRSGAGL